MNRFCIILLLPTVGIVSAFARTAPLVQDSPKQIVERFLAFETAGGRLTPDGWRKADQFFSRPAEPVAGKDVSVIFPRYSVSEPSIKEKKADVVVQVLPQGRMDPELRFVPSQNYKEGLLFHLVLVSTYPVVDSKGQRSKEVTGPPEWRLENTGPAMWLNIATTIRYVMVTREKTTNPIVRKNAEETLAELRKLH